MKTLRNYNKVLLGKNNDENIYLSPPSFDCGWYWGFGYLGNKNCHYHVDGLKKIETYNFDKKVWEYEFVNLYNGFKRHFGNSFLIRESQIWRFSELFETFYKFKSLAEIYKHGSCGLTSNPLKDLIINKNEYNKINSIILPAVFDEIYKIIDENLNNKILFKKIVDLAIEGNTQKIVDYMNKNNIKTDDLKNIDGISKHDFNIIHSLYWKQYHENKKNKTLI